MVRGDLFLKWWMLNIVLTVEGMGIDFTAFSTSLLINDFICSINYFLLRYVYTEM